MTWTLNRGKNVSLDQLTTILQYAFIILLPMVLIVTMVSVADPVQEPAQPTGQWVFEGYNTIVTSPLDYMIIWLLFGITFLIGLLFFINQKYHYITLLIVLAFMAAVNFFVIMTTLQEGIIKPPEGTALAFMVVIFGFGLIPTLMAFLMGGGLTYVTAILFHRPNLREDSYAKEWGQSFSKMAGFHIWRPRLFFISLYVAIILFIGITVFPVTEGSTYAIILAILMLVLGWIGILVLTQIIFNFAQSTGRGTTLTYLTRYVRRQPKRQPRKSSIRNIRKQRKNWD